MTRPRHAPPPPTQVAAEADMTRYLLNVRPHLRAGITVEHLVRCYRVPTRVAECRLLAAQGRWAREGAGE